MAEDTGLYTVKTVESDRAMNASINFYLFVLSKSRIIVCMSDDWCFWLIMGVVVINRQVWALGHTVFGRLSSN